MKPFILASLILCNLFAHESLDSMLKEYSQKADLSTKTKIENGGHLFIYTKNDLEYMQAKTLKDVLKSIPDFTYEESRFLYPDIYNGQYTSFNSHTMRIYLDNQELVSGNYGSGLPLYGNMSLGLIDHVEIYLGSPSFKFTTEPSLLIVKLYTKTALRSFGTKAKVIVGDDKYNQSWINHIDYSNGTEYQLFFDYTDDRQDKTYHKTTELSKDKNNFHFFSKIEKDTLKFTAQAKKEDSDAYINLSTDGTPEDSSIKTTLYDFNLEKKLFSEKVLVSLNHSIIDTTVNLNDDNDFTLFGKAYNSYYEDLRENVTTFKTTFEDRFGNHNIFAGFDVRNKDLNYKLIKEGNTTVTKDFDLQTVYSTYFQDEYYLTNNQMLTFGYKYYMAENNGGVKNYHGDTIRFGHILTNENFTFKTYYSDTDMFNEPYLINSTYGNLNITPMSVRLLSHEIIYEKGASKTALKLGLSKMIDTVAYNTTLQVQNISNTMDFNYAVLSNEYQIGHFKNFLSMYYSYRDNIPVLGKYDYKGAQLRTTYNLENLSLFSEIVYRQNDETMSDYYDLSLGAKYKVRKNLSLSVKGENILDKSYSSKFDVLINPTNPGLGTTPIYSQHTAKRFLVGLEYLF